MWCQAVRRTAMYMNCLALPAHCARLAGCSFSYFGASQVENTFSFTKHTRCSSANPTDFAVSMGADVDLAHSPRSTGRKLDPRGPKQCAQDHIPASDSAVS
jgi:hypothetical protein